MSEIGIFQVNVLQKIEGLLHILCTYLSLHCIAYGVNGFSIRQSFSCNFPEIALKCFVNYQLSIISKKECLDQLQKFYKNSRDELQPELQITELNTWFSLLTVIGKWWEHGDIEY